MRARKRVEEKKKILLVDDEEVFLEQLKDALEQSNLDLQIDTACDGLDALEKIEADRHDIVITDIKMPRMDGYALLKEIHNRYPTTYVVVVTAFGSISGAVEAMKYGAYDFLEKPFNMDTLEISLTKILRQHEILKENIELKGQIQQHAEGLDQLVGSHPKMQRLYEQILTAAETDLTVLILGETGTGKELIARSIHSRSDRRSKPFVVINCAAIPENLLESEFFGHEKGAFSGAISQRIGKFEKAHTGTIFLDEIGDIPLDLQAKILRVLEDHRITRLGSNREIELDFRVICATNRPIQEMIRKELFREDLYYRISVLPIIVPPVRERREDISLLASHFISKYARKLNSSVRGFHPGPWSSSRRIRGPATCGRWRTSSSTPWYPRDQTSSRTFPSSAGSSPRPRPIWPRRSPRNPPSWWKRERATTTTPSRRPSWSSSSENTSHTSSRSTGASSLRPPGSRASTTRHSISRWRNTGSPRNGNGRPEGVTDPGHSGVTPGR